MRPFRNRHDPPTTDDISDMFVRCHAVAHARDEHAGLGLTTGCGALPAAAIGRIGHLSS